MRQLLLASLLIAFALPAAARADDKPAAKSDSKEAKPIKALLVLGGCCHDYAKQKDILTKGIASGPTSSGRSPTTPTRAPSTSTPSTRSRTGPRGSTSSSTTSARPT